MLSAIVFSPSATAGRPRPPGPVLRTLAALVPAAVDGVVRDVALLKLAGDGDLSTLADEAGCTVVEGADFAEGLARAVAAARSTALLVLKAGVVPPRLFGEEVSHALEAGPDPIRGLLLREEPTSFASRIFPGLLAPVAGVILPRSRLAGRDCRTFADVVRSARPATPLPSRALVRG